MGLFNFKNKKESSPSFINWIPLNSSQELEEIKKQSTNESILIFKHSTRCGISSMVKRQFEKLFTEEHQQLKVYYLDLLNYRDISNKIAEDFQVMHQSPQLLIIKNEMTVYNASHYDITETDLTRFL